MMVPCVFGANVNIRSFKMGTSYISNLVSYCWLQETPVVSEAKANHLSSDVGNKK